MWRAQRWQCLLFILWNSKCAGCGELMGLTAFVCNRILNMNPTTTSTQETEGESWQEEKNYKLLQPQHLSSSIWGYTLFPKTLSCNCSHCFYQRKNPPEMDIGHPFTLSPTSNTNKNAPLLNGMKTPVDAQHPSVKIRSHYNFALKWSQMFGCLCWIRLYGKIIPCKILSVYNRAALGDNVPFYWR